MQKIQDNINNIARKIKSYTGRNNHTEAALLFARWMENKEAIEQLEGMQRDQDRRMYATPDEINKRWEIVSGMLKEIKNVYGNTIYQKLYICF